MADRLLSLAWKNHSSTFCHMLSTVREEELYTDVTIACDGKFYPAHKLVLSTCSDYFHKMFERTPCKHPVIVIKGVEGRNMEALLNYMYAGVVNVSQGDLAHLIRAAELLEIKGLAIPDEPASGKRPAQGRESSVDGGSPNSKRLRQEEKRPENQEESPRLDSSATSSQSPSVRRDGSGEEQVNSYDSYDKANRNQTYSEDRLGKKDIPGCGTRSEEASSEAGLERLTPVREDTEVTSGSSIKDEKIEVESDSETGEVSGYKYGSLMTDLLAEGREAKEPSVLDSFSQSLSEDHYQAEAGPSGLQAWPGLDEGGEAGGPSYVGGIALGSHSGQQLHHSQHMVTEGLDVEGGSLLAGLKPHKMHHCPYCPYSADFNYLLLRHIRTHTGEKPYCCPQCSYRASRKDSLKQHMATHLIDNMD